MGNVRESVFLSNREADEKLVRLAQQGDERAFELLVMKYQKKLVRLVSRFMRDPGDVEDVAQESFIKAYRALKTFRGDSAFYTWLYRIGVNTAKNHLMANGHRMPTMTEVDAGGAEGGEEKESFKDLNTPESQLASRQIAESVNQTLQQLPETLRAAIMLREIEGLGYEHIARLMNCPIGTVRSRIFRAREAIAQGLRPHLDMPNERRW